MESLQRHPAGKSFGEQNTHMIAAISAVAKCVAKLINRGITVLAIRVGGHKPIVIVQYKPLLDTIPGVAGAVAIGPRGREQMITATVDGCSVQWSAGI
jgi:hypothetical protein